MEKTYQLSIVALRILEETWNRISLSNLQYSEKEVIYGIISNTTIVCAMLPDIKCSWDNSSNIKDYSLDKLLKILQNVGNYPDESIQLGAKLSLINFSKYIIQFLTSIEREDILNGGSCSNNSDN